MKIIKVLMLFLVLGLVNNVFAERLETEVITFQNGIKVGSDTNVYTNININSASAELDYVIPYALTVTVQRVHGWKQGYWPTGPTTILIEDGGTGTMDQVNLALRAFTNSIQFGSNNVTFSETVVPGTNAADITTITYYSPVWATNWSGAQL